MTIRTCCFLGVLVFQRREARRQEVGVGARRVAARHVVLASTLVLLLLALAFVGGVRLVRAGPDEQPRTDPYVGSEIHMLNAFAGRIYVGGHGGAAVTSAAQVAWTPLGSLSGRDVMAVAETAEGVLLASHQGLFGSRNFPEVFTPVAVEGFYLDIHAVGASENVAYLASPEAGLLVSTDAGSSWNPRSTDFGQGLMGSILVDPADTKRLLSADEELGLVSSDDGGRTWDALDSPSHPTAIAWDSANTERLMIVGPAGGASSEDGGQTWSALPLPEGAVAVAYSDDGVTRYAAALDGERALVFSSVDSGRSWARLTG